MLTISLILFSMFISCWQAAWSPSLASQPIPFRSADHFQYRHTEEGSGDLGPLYMNSWMQLLDKPCVMHAIYCIATPTQQLCVGYTRWELLYAVCLSAMLRICGWRKLCGPLRWHRPSLTRITASLLVVKWLFTKFTTTFCCFPLRSYSSFRLASMIVAKTTFWTFLPCQSQGINALMISLMWQNQL